MLKIAVLLISFYLLINIAISYNKNKNNLFLIIFLSISVTSVMISTSFFFFLYFINRSQEKTLIYKDLYKSIRRIQSKIEINEEFNKDYDIESYKKEIETIINAADHKIHLIDSKNKKIVNFWGNNE